MTDPAAAAATSDWRHEAECRHEDAELFFPIGSTGPAVLQIEEAKAVCRRCDVVDTCRRWALDTRQEFGVWGGMSEDERRSLKRREARAKARAAEDGGAEPDRPVASVPSPQQVLKGTRATRRVVPSRPRREPPRDRSLVDAGPARDLIRRAYAAGLSRRAVAVRVGADPQWVGPVGTGATTRITAEYEAKVLAALAEYADPAPMPAEGVGS